MAAGLICALLLGTERRAVAQASPGPDASPPSAQASPVVDPSSLEARTAVAQTVRVMTSILNVSPGMRVEEAREKLDKLADPKTPPKQEGGDAEEKGEKDEDADKNDKKPASATKKTPPKKDDDDEGETKILWKLKEGSPYQWVFIEADKDEKITAVFGYCWPDKPIPFREIGDVDLAPVHNVNQAAWDVLKPRQHYRIVANGANEKASQMSISLVSARMHGLRRPGQD